MAVNKVILIGNVGKDPEVKELNNGKVAKVSLATSEKWKDRNGDPQERTEWHTLAIYGKLAEVVEKFVTKGTQLYVEGSIHYSSKDEKYFTSINVNVLQLLGKREERTDKPLAESKPLYQEAKEDDLPW